MYLRCNRRLKDGKEHRYWNIVESKRCAGGKVVQRNVLYLGEINDSQHEAWCDVHFPTTDGRTLILTRYTELDADQKLLVSQLKLALPPQPPLTQLKSAIRKDPWSTLQPTSKCRPLIGLAFSSSRRQKFVISGSS